MKISDKGLSIIQEFEGCQLKAYKCPAGVWTIGYGHTGTVDGKAVCSGMTITKAKAVELLKSDVSKFEKNVSKFDSKYNWNQNQFDAMVSFAFNIGSIDQLTANGTRTIAEISNKILAYNKAGGKELAGLTRRRKAEKTLFDTKVSKSSNSAKTTTTTTKKKTTSNSSIKAGKKLTLKNVSLYASATSKTASSKVTGTYYVWSSEVVNNRIRITNSKDNVGKSSQITGWIDKSKVK